MVRLDSNDLPKDEEERVLEVRQSSSAKKSNNTIKEEELEESRPTTFLEESKEPAKPEFAPMHSNPYAQKKE